MFHPYRDRLTADFETTMAEIVWAHDMSGMGYLPAIQTMALYFAAFSPDGSGADLYSRLLNFLSTNGKLNDAVFASLNYDCILEQAAHSVGCKVDYVTCTPSANALCVLKVHGSVNFTTVDMQSSKPQLVLTGMTVETNIDYLSPVRISATLSSRFSNKSALYYPVLSLYTTEKFSYVAPGKIQEIRNRWSDSVSRASRLAIVGVRPNPRDTHIWDPIRDAVCRCFYVGGDDGFEGWREARGDIVHLGRTFEDGFDDLLEVLAE